MKRWGWMTAVFLLGSSLVAQNTDTSLYAVANIKLGKASYTLTQRNFREKVAIANPKGLTLTKEDQLQILDSIITGELIRMDQEAQGVKATDEDVMKQLRSTNPNFSDADIKSALEKKTGKSWEEAMADLKKQVTATKYFSQFPQFQELGKITVSDQEVKAYFDANATKFVAPEYVRVSHVFFDTKIKPKGSVAEIQKRAEDTLKKIRSGEDTFEEAVSSVSDDPTSSKMNGDLGFIPRSTDTGLGQQVVKVFGQDFLNSLFALKKGEVSNVLASNQGLHIVRVTQKLEKHFQTLDEPVAPGTDMTVRSYLGQMMLQQKQMAAQAKMIDDVGADLRKKAVIKTFEQYF